jgi:hypothetical protein
MALGRAGDVDLPGFVGVFDAEGIWILRTSISVPARATPTMTASTAVEAMRRASASMVSSLLEIDHTPQNAFSVQMMVPAPRANWTDPLQKPTRGRLLNVSLNLFRW